MTRVLRDQPGPVGGIRTVLRSLPSAPAPPVLDASIHPMVSIHAFGRLFSRLNLLVAATALSAFAAEPPVPAAPVAAAPQAQPGASGLRNVTRIYAELCASCHGARGEGGRAPSMLDDVWAHGGDDASILRSIRDGWLENMMPPFGAVLSPPELRAMVVFLRETREKARVEVKPPPESVEGLVVKTALHGYKIEVVASGLVTPWGIGFLPDGRLIVTERAGRVRLIKPGVAEMESLTGLPTMWHRQDGGLFDVAVHPDFARTGWIYLAFSESMPGTTGRMTTSATRVIRGRIRDGALVDQEDIFKATPELFWASNTHYGSRLFFDRAGFLYYSIGDRGRQDLAQDLSSPYGKLHRVHDDGRVPADNPFVKHATAVKTIFSYGHRNQQGIAQHPVTGELWTTEHGPRGGDELNVIAPGKNYGWPVITYGMNDNGTPVTDITEKAGLEQPVTYWTPSIAVSALEFYTGDKFPQWKNHAFMAALTGRQLRRLVIDGHKVTQQEVVLPNVTRVREVVTGPDGYLYVSLNNVFQDSPGQIIRLVPSDAPVAAP